jgi:hypothetical protein
MEGVTSMFSSKLEFKGAVIGMLLGDASIPKARTDGSTHHLQITHCMKQEQYLLKKKEYLEYLTGVRFYTDQVNNKDYKCCRLVTKTHPFYDGMRDHMYHEGRKTVDEHMMKCLTPLGLALWYLDDGSLSHRGNQKIPVLATCCFNGTEHEMMSRMLQKRFGLQWRVNRTTTTYKGVKKNIFILRLRDKDRENFFGMIKPFVPECLLYKIDDLNDFPSKQRVEFTCKKCGCVKEKWPQQVTGEFICGVCRDFVKNNKGTPEEISDDVLCSV